MYGNEYASDDDGAKYSDSFYQERYLEFWASFVEVFAAFGWIWSWHVEYLELIASTSGPISSRGWYELCILCCSKLNVNETHGHLLYDIIRTFDDPDLTANMTIAVAAIIYFMYNCQVIADFDQYETNKLYQLGDQVYLINSCLYLLASLRDCQWFWFMPRFGQYKTIKEIMQEAGSLQVLFLHISRTPVVFTILFFSIVIILFYFFMTPGNKRWVLC
jgi:hypothetical protein